MAWTVLLIGLFIGALLGFVTIGVALLLYNAQERWASQKRNAEDILKTKESGSGALSFTGLPSLSDSLHQGLTNRPVAMASHGQRKLAPFCFYRTELHSLDKHNN